MLKVAIPNKGQLAEPAAQMLKEAGYLKGSQSKNLVLIDRENDVEFFFLRPKDIAVYVAQGSLDMGITGQDMVQDSGVDVEEISELGFGAATFSIAGVAGIAELTELNNKLIATSYPGLLQQWLNRNSLSATIVRLDGAVENAIGLGVADYVADVVATGTTLQLAGLQIIGEPIMKSQAILISRKSITDVDAKQRFIRRINSVNVARSYVLMDYDIPSSLVEKACLITPGFESPTISALRDPNWSAIRVMVPTAAVHQIMDELYEVGARGILVTEITACRL
jgi:ATP phosphoribosyltransferase